MARSLPKDAEPFVDPSSTLRSIRQLTDAVERGDIDLSTLIAFTKAVAAGEQPRFSKTFSIPTDMIEAIRANPEVPARQIVYKGVADGRWTMKDAERYEANAAFLSERGRTNRVTRAPYLTRRRKRQVRRSATSNMFTPKIAVDILCSREISDGAKACLGVLLALAGKENSVTTYTSSLATELERTPRTIRNYFMELEAAGLITRRAGKALNTVVIEISPACRPTPYVEPREFAAFRQALRSENPALQIMAASIVEASVETLGEPELSPKNRRKAFSAFNLESDSKYASAARDGSGLRPPTTHSTLFIDPRRPLSSKRLPREAIGAAPVARMFPPTLLPCPKFDDSLKEQCWEQDPGTHRRPRSGLSL